MSGTENPLMMLKYSQHLIELLVAPHMCTGHMQFRGRMGLLSNKGVVSFFAGKERLCRSAC